MFQVEFYEDDQGCSEIWDWLEELRSKAGSDKNSRVQLKQTEYCIELLAENGTRLPESITKYLCDGIWELRPGNNRIFYFFRKNENSYVLLHHFRKKTRKTPAREIERAKAERTDYLNRENINENMG